MSSGVRPCSAGILGLPLSLSLSVFLSGNLPRDFIQNLITTFSVKAFGKHAVIFFFSSFATTGRLHILFHTFTWGHPLRPASRQNLYGHCRGNGTVTDVNVPRADFPSQSMASNAFFFFFLCPLWCHCHPWKEGSFGNHKLGGDVEASFWLLFHLQKKKREEECPERAV